MTPHVLQSRSSNNVYAQHPDLSELYDLSIRFTKHFPSNGDMPSMEVLSDALNTLNSLKDNLQRLQSRLDANVQLTAEEKRSAEMELPFGDNDVSRGIEAARVRKTKEQHSAALYHFMRTYSRDYIYDELPVSAHRTTNWLARWCESLSDRAQTVCGLVHSSRVGPASMETAPVTAEDISAWNEGRTRLLKLMADIRQEGKHDKPEGPMELAEMNIKQLKDESTDADWIYAKQEIRHTADAASGTIQQVHLERLATDVFELSGRMQTAKTTQAVDGALLYVEGVEKLIAHLTTAEDPEDCTLQLQTILSEWRNLAYFGKRNPYLKTDY